MKTNLRRQFAYIGMLVLSILVIPNSNFAQATMSLTPVVGPANPTSSFANSVSSALAAGILPNGSLTPLPAGVNVTNLFSSEGVGNAVYNTLSVTSSVPFTLASIGWSLSDPFSSFSGTMGTMGFSFTGQGFGIGTDGTHYTSGNANTPILAAYVIGINSTIDISGSTLAEALASWGSSTPFTKVGGYSLNGTRVSSSITYTVMDTPEPSVVSLIAIGTIALTMWRKRE